MLAMQNHRFCSKSLYDSAVYKGSSEVYEEQVKMRLNFVSLPINVKAKVSTDQMGASHRYMMVGHDQPLVLLAKC